MVETVEMVEMVEMIEMVEMVKMVEMVEMVEMVALFNYYLLSPLAANPLTEVIGQHISPDFSLDQPV
jgi:hypothetical protein